MSATLRPGQTFGEFELIRPLGEGAFAEVWLAVEHGEFGFAKQVALKVFGRLTEENRTTWRSFVNEVRLCGLLHHPNIVELYRAGAVEDIRYFSMEYVAGKTLGQLLRTVRDLGLKLPRSVVLDVGLGIAQALEHAHGACDLEGEPLGVVHRDLKPGNVLIGDQGHVKVADFGIARAATNEQTTVVGRFKGTPAYVAPEGWRSDVPVTAASDLFALGTLLTEASTQTRLFAGRSFAAISAGILKGDPAREAAAVAVRHPGLAPLVESLLQRDPARRPESAGHVVRQLRLLRQAVPAPGGLGLFLERMREALGDAPAARPLYPVAAPDGPLIDDEWAGLLSVVERMKDDTWSARSPDGSPLEPRDGPGGSGR